MARKAVSQKLSIQIAEEAQLLAEEKWIIDALTKIKKHRNCLQIERLHLENLKAQLKCDERKREHHNIDSEVSHSSQEPSTVQTASNSTTLLEFEIPHVMDYDSCNTEELNLAVTNSVFTNNLNEFDMEEEEDDIDNCMIDMNMFMYGKPSSDQPAELDV